MIKDENDTSILEAIRVLLYKLRGTDALVDGRTDEEVAELKLRFQGMVSGKVKPVCEKESIPMIIAAAKDRGGKGLVKGTVHACRNDLGVRSGQW